MLVLFSASDRPGSSIKCVCVILLLSFTEQWQKQFQSEADFNDFLTSELNKLVENERKSLAKNKKKRAAEEDLQPLLH